MRNRSVFLAVLILHCAAAFAAKQPGDFSGSYTGEVVVRSLSSTRVVVALDEHGLGFADRLFFADTARSVGPFSARSSVARIEYANGELIVVVPHDQRTFFFHVPRGWRAPAAQRREELVEPEDGNAAGELDQGFLQALGFEGVHLNQLLQLAAYAGLPKRISLDDVEQGKLDGMGPRVLASKQITPQNPTPPNPDEGSGCSSSCSVGCGGGSSCNITCTNGHCGSCTCVTSHGASCSCN